MKPISPSKRGEGPVMPCGGELGGEDGVAGGEGEGAALPHREFPAAGEPQCRAGRAGDAQRVDGLFVVQMPSSRAAASVAEIEP